MLYREWFSQYMAVYKTNLKPRTREEYNRMQRVYIDPFIGSMEMTSVTPEHVQLVLNAAADRGSRQAQAVYSLVHAVFARACRSRLVPWSPVDALDKPEHDEEPGKQLSKADYSAALPFVRNDLALSLALFAGLRRGEIAGLRWGDVDLTNQLIHVRRQRQRAEGNLIIETPKSAAGCRDIPIDPQLFPLLRRQFVLRPSSAVMPYAPEYPGNCWRDLQESSLLLSQHYRLHDLRHTYGSRLILRGVNLKVVQYLMGHSSLEVTLRVYSHIDVDQVADEMDRVYGKASLTAF